MRVDEKTGEILETEAVPYKHGSNTYVHAYDRSKVTCKRDVEDYFRSEFGNKTIKVRWTNWALGDLLDIDPSVAYKFKLLSELIIARNIVFETTDLLAEHLQVGRSRFKVILKEMKDCGLIREYKGHSGGRRWRYLEMNPTLVFKTYQARSEEVIYGSTSRFNSLHQFYIDRWAEPYILLEEDREVHEMGV